MNVTDFLVRVVEKTNGWVIVVVFAMYIGYHCYKKHKDGASLLKTLAILDDTVAGLLRSIEGQIKALTSSIDSFLRKG